MPVADALHLEVAARVGDGGLSLPEACAASHGEHETFVRHLQQFPAGLGIAK